MQRFSAITYRAINDPNVTDSEYRTLGAIAAYADEDGWCYPSQTTLADLRGVSRQTINTHVKKLESLGYLNVMPRYREDGGQTSNMMQVRLDFPPAYLTGGVKSKTLQGVSNLDLTGGVKPELDTNTTEETPQNNTIIELDADFAAAVKAYENNIGTIGQKISEQIMTAVDEYPEGWVVDAIGEAALHSGRSWKYIEKILSNWELNGRQGRPDKETPGKIKVSTR